MSDLQIPPCPTCGGSGRKDDGCPTPDGGSCGYTVRCPDCDGSGHHPDTIVYLHRASDSDMYQQLVAPRICERLSHHDVGCGWFVLDALTGDTG